MKKTILFATLLLLAFPLLAAQTITFTVIGIDCEHCAGPIKRTIASVEGVTRVELDWKKGLATVDVSPAFDQAKVRQALQDQGYEAIFPGEKRRDLEPLPASVREKLDIVSFPGTKRVDLTSIMAAGKITIVDFTPTGAVPAAWSRPDSNTCSTGMRISPCAAWTSANGTMP